MIKKWLRQITGIDEIRAAAVAAKEDIQKLEEQKKKLEEETELARLSPKERANKLGESWVAVLDVKVNGDNIRNGFFELDWNEIFIKELILNGYGTESDPEEEIVDRWFRTIVYDMFNEEGIDNSRGVGYINVVPISKGKSEVS